jgi:hypothetical protein
MVNFNIAASASYAFCLIEISNLFLLETTYILNMTEFLKNKKNKRHELQKIA